MRIKVLFVCLGNICRSPLAEAIFRKKVKEQGLENQIACDSAGTSNYHIGSDPDPRSVEVAAKHHTPIHHKGRQFKKKDQAQFDYLIAMDRSNFHNMKVEMGEQPEGLKLMREFDPAVEGSDLDVPDPYYGGDDGFENVYQMLDRSLEGFIDFLKKRHNL